MRHQAPRDNLPCVWRAVILATATFLSTITPVYCFKTDSDSKTVSTDGNYPDTVAAVAFVTNKNEDGWTVSVGSPGGTYTWPTMLDISIPHLVTIQGASASDRPTIKVTATTGFGIFLGVSDGKTVTVKDFKFDGWKTANGLFLIQGSGDDCFRLTNLEFTNSGTFGAWVSFPGAPDTGPGPYGLFDHCTFPSGGGLVFVRDNPAAKPDSWHRPMSWGTKHAVYIEDCVFSSPKPAPGVSGIGDGDSGGRLVVRHCTLTNMPIGVHGADSQPKIDGKNPNRSMLQVEIMHNTFLVTDALAWFFFLRGGSATVFDNTFNAKPGGFLNTMLFTSYYRAIPDNGVVVVDRFYPKDYLGTQQPGSGVVDKPGQDPNYPNEPWGSVPIYSWNNKLNCPITYGEIGWSDWCAANRDFFIGKARPGYTEFTYPHPLQKSGAAKAGQPPSNVPATPKP